MRLGCQRSKGCPALSSTLCSTRWDLGARAAYTLRYHVLSLAPLTLALCMLLLGSCSANAAALFMLLIAQAAAAGTAWPRLTRRMTGIVPWLPLSAIEVLALLAAAAALRAAAAVAARFWVRALRRALHWRPAPAPLHGIAAVAVTAAVLASSAAHPGAPALAGTAVLACHFATAAGVQHDAALDWLLLHVIGSVPALALVVGWAAGGGSRLYPFWSMDRAMMALAGAHACSFGWRRRGVGQSSRMAGAVDSAVCTTCAAVVALGALWGLPYLALYAASALQTWDLLTCCW
jgi:hypothetical protein